MGLASYSWSDLGINCGKFLVNMIVAIISDIHDNLIYLEKCISYCLKKNVRIVLCCGDITNNETIKKLGDFKTDVYLIAGNADNFTEDVFYPLPTIHYLGRTGKVIIEHKNIGLCHEPLYIEKMLKNNFDFIFYGHTHKPWVETKGSTQVINPGTLGGGSNPSTFALWDTDKPMPVLMRTEMM